MPKKTPVEYEAMIGGLMHRIETLEDQRASAIVNAEMWEDRAKKLERKEPHLVIDWESMCKDRDKAIEELEASLNAFLDPEVYGWAVTEEVRNHVRRALGIEPVPIK